MTDTRDGQLPEELLSAYADDECTPEERLAVEARLALDAEWRRILDEVVTARDAVRALPARSAQVEGQPSSEGVKLAACTSSRTSPIPGEGKGTRS